MEKIKIIIADDHQLFREGLKLLLIKDKNFEVIAEAGDGEELLEILEDTPVDVVLIDISMPKMLGLEVIEKSKKKFPGVKFIVITMHLEGEYIVKSVKSGAYGYLLKNSDERELKMAIKFAFAGKKYFNQEISELMVQALAKPASTIQQLSPREIEVLQMISDGKITKEIADQLCVSTRTIETHRNNMIKKLKVQNTAELIKKAYELKLIQ